MNDQNFRKQSYDQINDITQKLRFLRKKIRFERYSLDKSQHLDRGKLTRRKDEEKSQTAKNEKDTDVLISRRF